MSLIPCPACGNEVSAQAQTCPRCGHPLATVPAAPATARATPEPWRPPSRARATAWVLGITGTLILVVAAVLVTSGAFDSGKAAITTVLAEHSRFVEDEQNALDSGVGDVNSRIEAVRTAARRMRAVEIAATPADFREAYVRNTQAHDDLIVVLERLPRSMTETFLTGFFNHLIGETDGGYRRLSEDVRAANDKVRAANQNLVAVVARHGIIDNVVTRESRVIVLDQDLAAVQHRGSLSEWTLELDDLKIPHGCYDVSFSAEVLTGGTLDASLVVFQGSFGGPVETQKATRHATISKELCWDDASKDPFRNRYSFDVIRNDNTLYRLKVTLKVVRR